jgi:hypothetical protein
MSVRPESRPNSIHEWRAMFEKQMSQPKPIPPKPKSPKTSILDQKGNSSSGKKNYIPLIMFLVFALIIVIGSQWSSDDSIPEITERAPAAAPAAPTPTQVLSQDSIILKEIEGSWAEGFNQCGVSSRDFIVNVNKSNEFVIRVDSKSFRRKIASAQKIDGNTYVILSNSVSNMNESYEEHYRLTNGSLRLVKRIVNPTNDAVKVFNGKNFQDGTNTPTLVKCN